MCATARIRQLIPSGPLSLSQVPPFTRAPPTPLGLPCRVSHAIRQSPAFLATWLHPTATAAASSTRCFGLASSPGRHLPLLRGLLRIGADPGLKPLKADFGAGLPALKQAASYDLLEAVQLLIHAGADANALDEEYQEAPLHVASDPRVVQALLDAGASLSATDMFGMTPLHRAAGRRNGAAAVAALLDQAGGSVAVQLCCARDGRGHTPLSWARKNGNAAAARLLCKWSEGAQ